MTYYNQVIEKLIEIADEKYLQTFVLQKTNDGITFANSSRLLLTSPNPSDLDKDATLDFINQSNISQVSETLLIDETWTCPSYDYNVRNEGKAVMMLGIGNYSSNSSCVVDAVVFQLGTIDTNAAFTAVCNATANYDYSTNATLYTHVTKQANFENISIDCSNSTRLALRTKVYGHTNNSNVMTNFRLETTRGSYDSYLTLLLNKK